MSLTHEQYLALSKIAYVDFSDEHKGLEISRLSDPIKDKFNKDNGYETNPIIQKIIPQISNYKLIAHQPNTNAGFSGSAFQAPNGEIIFAFRGTEGLSAINDLWTDGYIAFSNIKNSSQFQSALRFVEDVLRDNSRTIFSGGISFTGHSLGGALAQYMAYSFKNDDFLPKGPKAVTFNAPGIVSSFLGDGVWYGDYDTTNYINHLDWIGNWSAHVGKEVILTGVDGVDYRKIDHVAIEKISLVRIALYKGEISGLEAKNRIDKIKQSIGSNYDKQHTLDIVEGRARKSFVDNHSLESLLNEHTGKLAQKHPSSYGDVKKTIDSALRLKFSLDVLATSKLEGNYKSIKFFGKRQPRQMQLIRSDYYHEPTMRKYTYNIGTIIDAENYVSRFKRQSFTASISSQKAEYQRTVANAQRRIDPLVLDMDGDGKIETIASDNSSAHFDLDSNGFAEKTGWIGKGEGLLVLDRNQDGVINNGGELFGDQTLLKDGETLASSGFQALAEFDDNSDGVINSSDAIFTKLRVWRDANSDGISGDDELSDLTTLGIVSIGLSFINTNITDAANNIQVRTGDFAKSSGEKLKVGEYLFQRDASVSHEVDFEFISDEIEKLPELAGSGNVGSLRVAMMKDDQLKNMVEDFINSDFSANLADKFEKIIFQWAGVGAVIDGSRGDLVSAKKMAFLERIFALDYEGVNGANPNRSDVAESINRVYSELFDSLYAKFLMQGQLKDVINAFEYGWNVENSDYEINADKAIAKIVEKVEQDSENAIEMLKSFSIVLRSYGLSSDRMLARLWEGLAIKSADYALALNFANPEARIGGAGNDELYSNSLLGSQLFGQDGDDKLFGDSGSDILDGGAGNDELYVSQGDDTFVFKRGYGKDRIMRNISNKTGSDKVLFGEDIRPEDVVITRKGKHLLLTLKDSNDSLEVQYYFGKENNNYRIKEFKFADGTNWNYDHVAEVARTIYGTDSGEAISGYSDQSNIILAGAGNDELYSNSLLGSQLFGQDGDDKLFGESGSDILDGGAGNDELYVSQGDDTFVFKRGYGKDRIMRNISNKTGSDKVLFGEDIRPEDVMFENKDGNMIIILNKNKKWEKEDSLQIYSWKNGQNYAIDKFSGEGFSITSKNVMKMIEAMNEFQKEHGFSSWQSALTQNHEGVRQIVDNFWIKE